MTNGKSQLMIMIVAGTILALSISVCAQPAGPAKPQPQKQTRPPSTSGAAQSKTAVDETLKRADKAREGGQLGEALELYIKVLQVRPKWADGWWYVGTILYDEDRYPEARDAFRNLVAIEPKRGPAWGLLGLCEFQTREYERAMSSLQRGRVLGLTGSEEIERVVRYHTALLYIRLEQFEFAFEILREFMRTGYENPKIVEAFGLSLMRLPFLPNELPAHKREQVLMAGRAGLDMAAIRKDEARKDFSELLARYPEAPNVHYAFGLFLLSEDADAALEEFHRELKISPAHVPTMVQLAFEYYKRKEFETGRTWAEQSVKLAPKLFPARNILGRTLLELGEIDRAVKELEEGVRLAPESPEMRYALARAYTRLGRREDAARERATFQRLEKLYSAQRAGTPPPEGTDGPRIEEGTGNTAPKPKP